jgi:hypothetical protein
VAFSTADRHGFSWPVQAECPPFVGRTEARRGWPSDFWQVVFLGWREWRAAHPRATVAAIEAELDRRWVVRRGRLLTALARARTAADLSSAARPGGPACGGPLRDAGGGNGRG